MKLLDISTPVGVLCACEENGALKRLGFGASGCADSSPLLTETARQLDEYFSGRRQAFDLPLAPDGTEFQRLVWLALCDIPYGEARSYADIAAAIGNPQAVRAVGMANHVNPIVIIVPCHRVIGKNGSLTGYAGGLDTKRFLLELEAKVKGNSK